MGDDKVTREEAFKYIKLTHSRMVREIDCEESYRFCRIICLGYLRKPEFGKRPVPDHSKWSLMLTICGRLHCDSSNSVCVLEKVGEDCSMVDRVGELERARFNMAGYEYKIGSPALTHLRTFYEGFDSDDRPLMTEFFAQCKPQGSVDAVAKSRSPLFGSW
ncbi:MAG: hypothetical protein ACXWT0_03915 [Methylobacter sp.]